MAKDTKFKSKDSQKSSKSDISNAYEHFQRTNKTKQLNPDHILDIHRRAKGESLQNNPEQPRATLFNRFRAYMQKNGGQSDLSREDVHKKPKFKK